MNYARDSKMKSDDVDAPVRVYTTRDSQLASLIEQSFLTAGLSCFVEGEPLLGRFAKAPLYVNVRREDEDRAREMAVDIAARWHRPKT